MGVLRHAAGQDSICYGIIYVTAVIMMVQDFLLDQLGITNKLCFLNNLAGFRICHSFRILRLRPDGRTDNLALLHAADQVTAGHFSYSLIAGIRVDMLRQCAYQGLRFLPAGITMLVAICLRQRTGQYLLSLITVPVMHMCPDLRETADQLPVFIAVFIMLMSDIVSPAADQTPFRPCLVPLPVINRTVCIAGIRMLMQNICAGQDLMLGAHGDRRHDQCISCCKNNNRHQHSNHRFMAAFKKLKYSFFSISDSHSAPLVSINSGYQDI